MSKKAGIALIAAGALLLLSAILLLVHNGYEARRAGREAESALAEVERAISARGDVSFGDRGEETAQPVETPLDSELPVAELEGYEYVGYLEIPALELKLPVMAEWDYERLKIAPCRQFGSSRTDDLVIAAHNYDQHFGRLKDLKPGDAVAFTDMEGLVNTYAVVKTATLDADEVDAARNSGYALVLYTCTYGGKARVTVFCDRVSEAAVSDGRG